MSPEDPDPIKRSSIEANTSLAQAIMRELRSTFLVSPRDDSSGEHIPLLCRTLRPS